MNKNSAEFELVALKCPQCGGQMEGLICGYCGSGFKKVSAPEKP